MSCNVNIAITTSIVVFSFAYFTLQGNCCPALPGAIGDITADYDLLVGDDLIVNCSLFNNWLTYKDGRTLYVNSSMLFFKFDKEYITENVKIIDERNIHLKIPNASVENSGKYYCFLVLPEGKKRLVCNNAVSVGYAPFEVANFTCLSLSLSKLRCKWDVPKNTVETKYTLHDNLSSKTNCSYRMGALSRRCPGPIDKNNENSCQWSLDSSPVYRPSHEKLCFEIVGNNSLGTIKQFITIDHYSIVQPGNPLSLIIRNVTANTIIALWLPPFGMSSKEEFPPGLAYEIQYKPRYTNTWQVVKLDNETRINISNLIPHTDYDFRVRCRSRVAKSDNLWSDFATTSFRTDPDIPYLAPEVAPGLFETRHLGGRRNITLYWKAIPKQFWNGESFSYIVTCIETYIGRGKRSVYQEKIVSSEKSSLDFVGMDIHSAYEFTLSSLNDRGKSRNFSKIIVQRKENMPQIPRNIKVIKLMHHKGHYNISWESPSQNGDLIESYTIFWCSRPRPSLFPCNGPFSWKFLPASVRAASLSLPVDDRAIQFALSADSKYGSSGLEWAACVIPSDGVLDKINTISPQPLSSTSLNIVWYLDCPGYKHIVQEYKISYCKVKNYNGSCSGEVKEVTITNKYANNYTIYELEPYTLYRIIAVTITKSGSSEESDPVFARTKAGAPSDPPQNFSILNKTETTIEVIWFPPLELNGNIERYVISIRRNGYDVEKRKEILPRVQKLSAKFERLVPYTNYTLELEACVHYDCSPPTLMHATTEIGVPGPMEVPVPEVYNETFVEVSWTSPSEPNGPVDFYVLYMQWESGDESHTESVNVSGTSYDLTVTCPTDDKVMLYFFSIQAVNIKGKELLYGNRSNSVQGRLCYSNNGMELGIIIGMIVGAAAALAFVIISLYFLIRWMKKKVDTIKDIKVQLPCGLETPHGNPLNSYENFKNGLVRKPSDSNLSPKTFYGRLNSYASDESDLKDRNDSGGMAPFGNNSREALIHNMKDQSDGKSNNGGTNIGKGHDSISSSLTTRTQLSSDSGAETDVQAPPSPESDNVPLGLLHSSPQPNKSSLPKVNEARSCDSKDSGLEKEEGGSEKESDASDPNHYAKFVRYLDNPNHPYNRRQVSGKGTLAQQLPYSKFGVNMPGISGYVPLSSTLAQMSRSLANSEPSVVDAETVNKTNPDLDVSVVEAAPPYSKYGIGRSLGQSLNMPILNEADNLGTGYSKCGIGPSISWLQQPKSPYIAATLEPVLLGSNTSQENKQLNPTANDSDLNKVISPLPLAPSCSSPSRNKGYVTVDSMNKPSSFLPNRQINGPAYSCLEENKMPHSKGYVSVQDAKNMLSDDRKLPQPSETKDQATGIPGYSKFDIQCDRLQNTPDIQTLDPVLTGTKPKTYPSGVHQGYVPYQNPAFDVSSVSMPFNNNDHPINGILNGDLSPMSADMNFGCENEYEFDTDSHSPSKYLPQTKTCKPASELSNGYVTVNPDSSIDAIRIVPTDSHLRPSLTDTAV